MKWTWVIPVVVVLTAGYLFLDLNRRPAEPVDRGPAGIDFDIPDSYTVLELGESAFRAVAVRMLEAVGSSDRVAAVFTRQGDRIQLLADLEGDTIEERRAGQAGTVWLVFWPGSVRERLGWAARHGTLEAPGLPPPERRNPYH